MSLRVVPDETNPAPAAPAAPGPAARFRLDRWKRMEVEAARKLVADLETIGPEQLAGPLGCFWLGRITGAAENLLDILDAVTEP